MVMSLLQQGQDPAWRENTIGLPKGIEVREFCIERSFFIRFGPLLGSIEPEIFQIIGKQWNVITLSGGNI